jgi:D-3-phosphoglycerate dehydrogenase
MTYRILVSDKLSEDGLDVFRNAGLEVDHLPTLTQDEIKDRIHEYDGWVVRSRSKATADIIAAGAKRLRVIGRAGVGVDNVDVEAASRHGIIVMNTPGGNTVSTGEHTIAMMMSIARKIPMAHASTHAGGWEKNKFMGVEFANKTLGILGFGRIGQEVAKRMMAFEMRVIAYDPFVSPEVMKQMGVEPGGVDEICKRADFITIHTPLSPETKKLINAERLRTMKKTTRLVNCARGGIVDEEALAEALKTGVIAGAVFEPDYDRIVRVNDRSFNAVPKGTLVVVENDDVPGIIGAVGTYFGERKLNISEMTWGRREMNVHAMTIINVEGEVTAEDLEGLQALDHINTARLIRL